MFIEEFVIAFETDENDESSTFEETIGQALALMNGPLVEKALQRIGG